MSTSRMMRPPRRSIRRRGAPDSASQADNNVTGQRVNNGNVGIRLLGRTHIPGRRADVPLREERAQRFIPGILLKRLVAAVMLVITCGKSGGESGGTMSPSGRWR
jgi:hypothetical protein